MCGDWWRAARKDRQQALTKICLEKGYRLRRRDNVSSQGGWVAKSDGEFSSQRALDERSGAGRFLGRWLRNRGESAYMDGLPIRDKWVIVRIALKLLTKALPLVYVACLTVV
ncbi:MAG TPA: hypothetical protein DCG57_19600 [Candidatus Riflebacteria bacterium]|nr:hypothetical protein [Candidatus Riflebacteria bacterium]